MWQTKTIHTGGREPSLHPFRVGFSRNPACSGGRERRRQNPVGPRLLQIWRDGGTPGACDGPTTCCGRQLPRAQSRARGRRMDGRTAARKPVGAARSRGQSSRSSSSSRSCLRCSSSSRAARRPSEQAGSSMAMARRRRSRGATPSREGSCVARGVQGGEVEHHGAESEEELPRLVLSGWIGEPARGGSGTSRRPPAAVPSGDERKGGKGPAGNTSRRRSVEPTQGGRRARAVAACCGALTCRRRRTGAAPHRCEEDEDVVVDPPRAAHYYSSALVGMNSAASSSSASGGRRTPLRRALLDGRRA
jgi:hypothetical protein